MKTLPLTSFEEYLYYMNQGDVSSNIWFNMRFTGTVDPSCFEKAVKVVEARHPLLTATVSRGRFGRLHWQLNPDKQIPIRWVQKDPLTHRPQFDGFDPSQETSIELHVIFNQDRWDLHANISHALCDGIGALKAVSEILIEYNRLSSKKPLPFPALDSTPLPERKNSKLGLRKMLTLLPYQIGGFLLSLHLLKRTVSKLQPISSDKPDAPLPPKGPHFASAQLDNETLFAYRRFARTRRISFECLCLAAFHAAIGRWRKLQGIDSPDDWIRISLPVNLRNKEDGNPSTRNSISIISIDRQAKNLAKRERLLQRAKEDMQKVQQGRLDLTYLLFLWIRKRFPGGIRTHSRRDVCRSTAVLSYMGPIHSSSLSNEEGIFVAGGSRLNRIFATTPYTLHTQTTLLIGVYAGKLAMNLHYNARDLSHAQAVELLDCFTNELDIMTGNA